MDVPMAEVGPRELALPISHGILRRGDISEFGRVPAQAVAQDSL